MLTPSGRPEAPRTLHFTSVSCRGGVWDHPLLTPLLGGPRRSGPSNLRVIPTAGGRVNDPLPTLSGKPQGFRTLCFTSDSHRGGAGNHPLMIPSGKPEGLRTLHFSSDSHREGCGQPPSADSLWEARGAPDPVFYE